ncbi:hypothetical protein ACOSQ2_007402 [Xanthoceras sorbifolium]
MLSQQILENENLNSNRQMLWVSFDSSFSWSQQIYEMTSKSIHPVLKDLASTPILGTGTELFRADEFPTKRAFAETCIILMLSSQDLFNICKILGLHIHRYTH